MTTLARGAALASWILAAVSAGAAWAGASPGEPEGWLAVVRFAGPEELARGELSALRVRYVGESALVAQGDPAGFDRLPREVFDVRLVEPLARGEAWFVQSRHAGAVAPEPHAALRRVWTEPDFLLLAGPPGAARTEDPGCAGHLQSLPGRVSLRSYGPHAAPFSWSARARATPESSPALAAGELEERLGAHVSALAWNDTTGAPRSRWAYRPETASVAAEYIRQAYLEALAGRGSVTLMDGFRCGHQDSVTLAPNVIARLPGRGRGEFLVTAHYDAVGSRTGGWVGATDPAPGADDNASGVAATIEVLRALAPLEFDFDIVCVAWACEEILPDALWGSRAYAAEAAARGDSIWGVINLDMIGYARPGAQEKILVLTNNGSQWLADLLLAAGEPAGFTGPMGKFVGSAFNFSDHYPFWLEGYDAVLMTEDLDVRNENLQYHRVTDLPETVSSPLMAAVVRTVTAALTGLENRTLPDLALGPGALRVRFAAPTDRFARPGDQIEFEAVVRNLGEPMRAPATVQVQFARAEPFAVLAETPVTLQLLRGESRVVTSAWVVTPDAAGEVELTARLLLPGGLADLDASNQEARITFDARQDALRILEAHCYPNPLTGPGELMVSVELSREADLTFEVVSLAGERIAGPVRYSYAESAPDVRPEPGRNLYPWSAVAAGAALPGSGLYTIRVTAAGADGGGEETTLVRFAVRR